MERKFEMGMLGLLALVSMCLPSWARELVPGNPAKLNIVVYCDFEVDNPDTYKPFFVAASKRLFEATEGQFQLGRVEVHVDCPSVKNSADMVVSRGNGNGSNEAKGAHAHVGGYFRGGQMYFLEYHLQVPELGSGTFVHELGHYLFGLQDEYEGIAASGEIPPGVKDIPATTTDADSLFFCTHEAGAGIACIMNSGTTRNIHKREFCTPTGATAHNPGVTMDASFSVWNWARIGTIFLNNQQALNYSDCWSSAKRLLESQGHSITVPADGAQATPGEPTAIDFEVVECNPAVALVLDVSGSMSGARMANLKRAASQTIGVLEDGAKVSIVSYSSSASVLFPMQKLNDTNRGQALAAVASLAASGNTNIGGGILAGLNQILGEDPRLKPEVIVLLTDGEHNTGTSPTVATAQVTAAGVTMNSVGLGQSFDASQLQSASEQTGGSLVIVRDERDLAAAIIQQTTGVQGDSVVSSQRGRLTPGQSVVIDIPVDEFAQELSLASSWSTGQIQLSLSGPSGTVPVSPDLTSNSNVTRVPSPSKGIYQLTLTASATGGDIDYDLQALVRSPQVIFLGNVRPTGAFPAPYKIEAHAVVKGLAVAGAKVRGLVTEPGGSSFEVELFDDGGQGHGDDHKGDGTYSNLLSRSSGNGNYEVRIIIENSQGVGVPGFEKVEGFSPARVSDFVREVRTAFLVSDYSSLSPGSLTMEEETEQLTDYSSPYDRLGGIYMLKFRLKSGSGEPVRITSMKFEGTGSGNESLAVASVYRDINGDGRIDATGPTFRPLAVGTFDSDDGVLTLRDPITLSPDETAHFILTYQLPKASEQFAQSAFPMWALSLLGLFGVVGSRRVHQRKAILMLLLVAGLTLTGCGDGADWSSSTGSVAISPQPNEPGEPVRFPATTYKASLVDIKAEGAVSGAAITISNFAPVTGPTATLE